MTYVCVKRSHLFSQPSRRLINTDETLVDDTLRGIVSLNKNVVLLEKTRILLRRDHATGLVGKVKLLSGSGAGHEPAFTGYVGCGMLTACVQGNLYETPSSRVILEAMYELGTDHFPGILIIIPNITQIRLTFKVAVEKAIKAKINVKLLVVSDDCYGNRTRINGRLGLTGVILVMKIAGAMAEAGESLDTIYNYCQSIANNLSTCSVSIKSVLNEIECGCVEPIATTNQAKSIQCELGVGFRYEPSVERQDVSTASDVVKLMINNILNSNRDEETMIYWNTSTSIYVMLNNLGISTPMENLIFAGEVTTQLQAIGFNIKQIFSDTYMTSSKNYGYTITLLKDCDNDLNKYLNAPCQVTAWKQAVQLIKTDDVMDIVNENDWPITIESVLEQTTSEASQTPVLFGPKFSSHITNIVAVVITFACDALISCEKQLNRLDVDSDTGTNVANVATIIKYKLLANQIDVVYPGKMLMDIYNIVQSEMLGTLGALYTCAFEAAAEVFQNKSMEHSITGVVWLEVFETVIEKLKKFGEVDIGDKTMVDGIDGAIKNINELNRDTLLNHPLLVAKSLAEGAEMGAALTMSTHLKRKGSILTRTLKDPDPGAHVVAVWMRAVYEGLKVKLS